MRPTVGETLVYVKGMLAREILPDVASPYARRLGDELVATLARLEHWWDRVLPNLMEENDELRRLFTSALSSIDDAWAGQASPAMLELAQQIRRELASDLPDAKYPSHQSLENDNQRYRALLELAIAAFETVDGPLGDDPELARLRLQMRRHVGKYLEREVELRGIDINAPRRA